VIAPIGIGPLGASEWAIPPVTANPAAPASGSGSFGDVLTNAIGSLENTVSTASQTSTQLATGQLSDPTQAVTAVENASLAMDFAAEMRNQLTSAATTLFQTQV
jgi:flagellar hook-basal body complex protein FliE